MPETTTVELAQAEVTVQDMYDTHPIVPVRALVLEARG